MLGHPPAMTFAHQVTKMVETKAGINLNLMRPVGGNPSRISCGHKTILVVAISPEATHALP